ncbi:MAG: PPC domain-containing protein [Pseudanabaena sp.]
MTTLIAGIISSLVSVSVIVLSCGSESFAQSRNVYKPTTISSGSEINDLLTDKDIPTGQKGFARDYILEAQKDERLEITVNSGGFDTVLSLLDSKGEVIAENDDAASDTTNSLIFFKVRQSGTYTIRVSSFGGSSGGKFTLKVTKLRVVS